MVNTGQLRISMKTKLNCIERLKQSKSYCLCPPDLAVINSVFSIYVFHIILPLNSDYFLKQH
jgi:hypothetical protein